jgi:hypothetical protein
MQDVEKVPQRRSRVVQTLNVPQRVRLGPSLAAALLEELFEHPAERLSLRRSRSVRRHPEVSTWVSPLPTKRQAA